MAYLDGVLVLLALAALCAFLALRLKCAAGVLPLPVLAGSGVWLCLFGFVGQLRLGAVLWLVAGGAAAVWLALQPNRRQLLRRVATPGFVFFLAAALGLWVLFAATKPMFILWDEFTFWGTACKMTVVNNTLHAAAPGNLAARSYTPGMMLLCYLFQFLSGGAFAEWKCFATYDILCLAAVACLAETEKKRWPLAVFLTLAGVLLPYFFTEAGAGGISTVYVTVMGDVPLGLLFGGALCFYWRAGHSPAGLLGVGCCLAFLTLVKDMGFAYALMAAALIFLDRFLAAKKVGLRSLGGGLWRAAVLCVPVLGLFFGWSRYVLAVSGIDKNAVGSTVDGQASYTYGQILADGAKQLVGMGSPDKAEKFAAVRALMLRAFTETKICLLGSGALALGLTLAVLLAAGVCAQKGAQRRRVAVLAVGGTLALGALMLFHLFLYVYNFTEQEALVLKDYARYLSPFYLGFLLASIGLLACVAQQGAHQKLAQAGSIALAGALAAAFCAWCWPSAGFWNYPHENYSVRQEVAQRAAGVNSALNWDDTVYLISQGDDATRWYYYGYELNAQLANGFAGFRYVTDTTENWETTFANLVNPYTDDYNATKYAYQKQYSYTAECNRDDLVGFLREKGYSHLLLDVSDTYIYYEMGPLFTEKIPMFRTDAAYLYKIEDDGETMRFVPVGEVRYEPE